MVHLKSLTLVMLILYAVILSVFFPTGSTLSYKEIEEKIRNEIWEITSAEKEEKLIHLLTQERYDHQKMKEAHDQAKEKIIKLADEMGKLKEKKTRTKYHSLHIPIDIKIKTKGTKTMDISV